MAPEITNKAPLSQLCGFKRICAAPLPAPTPFPPAHPLACSSAVPLLLPVLPTPSPPRPPLFLPVNFLPAPRAESKGKLERERKVWKMPMHRKDEKVTGFGINLARRGEKRYKKLRGKVLVWAKVEWFHDICA